MKVFSSFDGLLWFVLTLLPLVFLQRLLHREIQAVFLILSRSERFTVTLFSIIFLPGVLLHELSHYGIAVLLGVKAARFSLIPQVLEDGRLQLGYVETVKTDFARDSLVGAAPLIVGGGFVAFVALVPLHLQPMWDVLRNGQLGLFWFGITGLFTIHDFPLWFYLTFAVSSTMLPSQSDRHAWLPLGVTIAILDRAGDFGGHRSVDADVSRTAVECVPQRGGNYFRIERGRSRGVDRADFFNS